LIPLQRHSRYSSFGTELQSILQKIDTSKS
jgi:hypothetical protein